jgi:amino acid transporter
MFLGWIVVLTATECVAVSLGELTSRYTTAAGPAYWTFQLAPPRYRKIVSFLTGWLWLIGGWTTTLSVNFGFASLIAACIAMFHPEFEVTSWQFLLLFCFLCCLTFLIVAFGNKLLPLLDTICAAFTVAAVVVSLVCMFVYAKAGRRSIGTTLVSPQSLSMALFDLYEFKLTDEKPGPI